MLPALEPAALGCGPPVIDGSAVEALAAELPRAGGGRCGGGGGAGQAVPRRTSLAPVTPVVAHRRAAGPVRERGRLCRACWGAAAAASLRWPRKRLPRRRRKVQRGQGSSACQLLLPAGLRQQSGQEEWQLSRDFDLQADQPEAVGRLLGCMGPAGAVGGRRITLHGATGTGKTLVIASAMAALRRPTLWICPNKTLVWQVCQQLCRYFTPGVVSIRPFVSAFRFFRPAFYDVKTDTYREGRCFVDVGIARERDRVLHDLESVNAGQVVVASAAALFNCRRRQELNSAPGQAVYARIEDEYQAQYRALLEDGFEKAAENLSKIGKRDLALLRAESNCPAFENKFWQFSCDGTTNSLVDRFASTWGSEALLVFDESHLLLPLLNAQYKGARTRTEGLIQAGFRLPSCRGSGPRSVDEVLAHWPGAVVFASATPRCTELAASHEVAHMVNRPSHILDPVFEHIYVPPHDKVLHALVDHMVEHLRETCRCGGQALVACLTKREVAWYRLKLDRERFDVEGIHEDQDWAERTAILRRFQRGELNVLVGVNLLREGLDFPNVSDVFILRADSAGFLRSQTSLTQIAGRAARHPRGRVFLYAATETEAMRGCMAAAAARRCAQRAYNEEHGYEPRHLGEQRPSSEAGAPEAGAFETAGRGTQVGSGRREPADRPCKAAERPRQPERPARPQPEERPGPCEEACWEAGASLDQQLGQLCLAGCGSGGPLPVKGVWGFGRKLSARVMAPCPGGLEGLLWRAPMWADGRLRGPPLIGPERTGTLLRHLKELLNWEDLCLMERSYNLSGDGGRGGDEEATAPLRSWAGQVRRVLACPARRPGGAAARAPQLRAAERGRPEA